MTSFVNCIHGINEIISITVTSDSPVVEIWGTTSSAHLVAVDTLAHPNYVRIQTPSVPVSHKGTLKLALTCFLGAFSEKLVEIFSK